MGMDDQENRLSQQQPGPSPLRTSPRGWAFKLAAVAVTAVSLSAATGFLMLRLLHAPEPTGGGGAAPPAPKPPSRLFIQWPRDRDPDLVLLLSAEQDGYIQPCGCSEPQYGGLERRFNFLQTIKERGWPVVALDLGNVAQRPGPQAQLKYKYSMKALSKLDYTAVGVGANEMEMPLLDALAQWTLDNPNSPQVLAANLLDKDANFANLVGSWKVTEPAKNEPKVGVVGVVAYSVAQPAQKLDPSIHFDPIDKVLPAALKDMQNKKPDLLVLLFQGSLDEARACAGKFSQFNVILCLTQEEEPSSEPDRVGDTLIIGLGHKGRYVGLVGAYHTGKEMRPFDLHYQLVSMAPEYKTPEGEDAKNPILGLMEEYSRDVQRSHYLAQYPKTAHRLQQEFPKAKYVGSEKCQECHEFAYKVWKESPHAHAFDTLVKAKRPSLRQFDGECVACHVTGFAFQTGYTNEAESPHLKDNGCENCHGPGSLHVKGDRSEAMLAAMNPYKTQSDETPVQKQQRINRLDQSCQKCHDIDNDVHWKLDKWAKIAHPTPANEK